MRGRYEGFSNAPSILTLTNISYYMTATDSTYVVRTRSVFIAYVFPQPTEYLCGSEAQTTLLLWGTNASTGNISRRFMANGTATNVQGWLPSPIIG